MCQSHRVSVKRYRERMKQVGYQHIAAYLPPEDWRRYAALRREIHKFMILASRPDSLSLGSFISTASWYTGYRVIELPSTMTERRAISPLQRLHHDRTGYAD